MNRSLRRYLTVSIIAFETFSILDLDDLKFWKGQILLQFKHKFLSHLTSSWVSNLFLSSLLTSQVVIPHECPEFVFFCKDSNKFSEILKTFTSKLAADYFPNKSLSLFATKTNICFANILNSRVVNSISLHKINTEQQQCIGRLNQSMTKPPKNICSLHSSWFILSRVKWNNLF